MSQLRRLTKFTISDADAYEIIWRRLSDAIDQNQRQINFNDKFLIPVSAIRLVTRALFDEQLKIDCAHILINGDIFDIQILFPNDNK